MTRLTVTAVLVSAALAAPAAAATWSAPVTVSSPHTFVGPLFLEQSGQAALTLWGWRDGIGSGGRDGFGAAGRPSGGDFGPEHPAPPDVVDFATYGQTRALALSQTEAGRSGGLVRFRVAVAYGRTTTATFGSPRTIAVAPTAYLPRLGAGGTRAIVAYIQHTSRHRRAVRVATRAGGHFSHPYTLSGRGQADVVATATNHGDYVVAFVRNGRLLARVRRLHHHWGSILQLARATGATQWQVAAAIDGHGRVEVVWRRHQLGREGHGPVRSIESAYMPAYHFTWRGPQVVEPDGASPPVLRETPGGFAIAYAEDAPGGALPRVRLAAPRFGGPLDAGPARGGLRGVDVASGPYGLLATWVEPRAGGDGDGQGMGAFRPVGGGAFGPVEAVTPDENVHEMAVTADEQPAGYLAVWSARPEGTGPSVPIAQLRTVVRAATRSAG